MAYAVVRQTLSATLNGTADFTKAGFGTPTAALVIMCGASVTANPTTNIGAMSIGFWDGTVSPQSQSVVEIGMAIGTTSQVSRHSSDSDIAAQVQGGSAILFAAYTASAIADGIRLTLTVDATGVQRLCTVLLFDCDARLITFTPNGTQDATAESESLGFSPKLVLFGSIGASPADLAQANFCQISFGFAADDGTNRAVSFIAAGLSATEVLNFRFWEDRCVGQTGTWAGEATLGVDTFTMTTRDGATAGDVCFALALGGDVEFDSGTLSTPTAIGDQEYETDVTPEALLLVASNATGTAMHEDSGANGFAIGMADADGEFSHNFTAMDAADPTRVSAAQHATQVLDLDTQSGSPGELTAVCDATVAFNAADFTLDFSVVDSVARKGWWIAFGQAPAAASEPILVMATRSAP